MFPPIGANLPPVQTHVPTAPAQNQNTTGTLQLADGERSRLAEGQPAKPSVFSRMGEKLSTGFKALKDYLVKTEAPRPPRASGTAAPVHRPMTAADFDGTKGAGRTERGNAQGAEPSHRPAPTVTRSDYDSKLTETRTQARFLESVKAGRLVELAATDPQKLIDVINAQPADSPILTALAADNISNFKQVHNFITRFDHAQALAPGPQREAAMDSLYESCVKPSLNGSPFAKGNEFEVNLDGSTLPAQGAAAQRAGTGMTEVMQSVKNHLMVKLVTESGLQQSPVAIFTKDLQKVL